MGFAVDEQLESLGDFPPEVIEEIGHHERWDWEYPFTTFARLIDRGINSNRILPFDMTPSR